MRANCSSVASREPSSTKTTSHETPKSSSALVRRCLRSGSTSASLKQGITKLKRGSRIVALGHRGLFLLLVSPAFSTGTTPVCLNRLVRARGTLHDSRVLRIRCLRWQYGAGKGGELTIRKLRSNRRLQSRSWRSRATRSGAAWWETASCNPSLAEGRSLAIRGPAVFPDHAHDRRAERWTAQDRRLGLHHALQQRVRQR